MSVIKKPYEISLWNDELHFQVKYKDANGQLHVENLSTIEGFTYPEGATETETISYYDEVKQYIIGSNTMDTPIRAFEPKLVSNINGTNTLTFSMYSHYYDEETEQLVKNPYINYLVNEKKVKVRYGEYGAPDTKWFDLVIKSIDEDSESKKFTYTAQDLFINELSKSGFDLEFDVELDNNTGTIDELAAEVLRESDWELEKGDTLKQRKEEPLYEIVLKAPIYAIDMEDTSDTPAVRLFKAGEKIYTFYSIIEEKNPFFQFIVPTEQEKNDTSNYVLKDDINWVVAVETINKETNLSTFSAAKVTYNEKTKLPTFAAAMELYTDHRARRLVRKQVTDYDIKIGQAVKVYEDSKGTEYHGFTETEYVGPATVKNFVTNSENFDSTTGWVLGKTEESDEVSELEVTSIPEITESNVVQNTPIDMYLKLNLKDDAYILRNSGIIDNRSTIREFIKGEKYYVKIKVGKKSSKGALVALDKNKTFAFYVIGYTSDKGIWTLDKKGKELDPIFTKTFNTDGEKLEFESIITCQKSLSHKNFINSTNTLGMFLNFNTVEEIYIESVQFFKYVEVEKEVNGKKQKTALLPGEIKESQIQTNYIYYLPNSGYESREELEPVLTSQTPAAEYVEKYDKNFEKKRSITVSESNRFNILQDLSELFECWIQFKIEHDPSGKIKLDDNLRQKKYVRFYEFQEKNNYAGFKYGINLKSIRRKVDSDNIVTKIIVKNNSNEFAKDGFCSVARAIDNPSGENFILNFDYYIQHNMLERGPVVNDLYSNINGYINYYPQLKELNQQRDRLILEQSELLGNLAEYESQSQTYQIQWQEAEQLMLEIKEKVERTTSTPYETLITDKKNEWWQSQDVKEQMTQILRLSNTSNNSRTLYEAAKTNLDNAQNRYDEITRELTSTKGDTILAKKMALHKKFYYKYSRFLQEGPWISEDYIDDNLYYLDAESTLNTSAKPKITYDINVLELSQLEGYEGYTFSLGDKTFIEDVEFFGWKGSKPYQEEIIVTETTINFDSPENNQISVKNYKNSFEDLFQRIAASTQQLEFATGSYTKASQQFDETGNIKITTLQNSLTNNALTIQNAKDQSVIWDSTGITTSSPMDPAKLVRIVNGGIFLSKDGGINWTTGITGEGINANYITTGQINTDVINVMNNSFPSFRWDKYGISAYAVETNKDTGAKLFNYNKYVRYDQYGLYGIKNIENFDPNIEEEGKVGTAKIKAKGSFGLTWDGFFLKSDNHDGYISISNDNDFQVFQNDIDIIKIGCLDEEIYGMQVKDLNGKSRVKLGRISEDTYGLQILSQDQLVVLTQDSNGDLWLKDKLSIGTTPYTKYYVQIGKIGEIENVIPPHAGDKAVFSATNNFVIYEDGCVVANNIHATGGKIGNMTIEALQESRYSVRIETDKGQVFTDEIQEIVLTAILFDGAEEVTNTENFSYSWKQDGVLVGNTRTYTVNTSSIGVNKSSQFTCEITMQDGNTISS